MIVYEKVPFLKSQVWLTSDTHAFHKNICRGSSNWEGGHGQSVRDFDSPEDMNAEMIKQINENVKEDDLLIHLGDWSFDGEKRIEEFRNQINCKNIYLTYGNHDHNIRNKEEHQKHFTKTGDVMYLRAEGLRMFLSHYPQYVWHQGHQGVIHLYGHCHSSIEHLVNGKMMDVGVDNVFKLTGKYRPLNLLEIEEIMEEKSLYLPDHHKKDAN